VHRFQRPKKPKNARPKKPARRRLVDKVISPSGEVQITSNLAKLAREQSLNQGDLSAASLNGRKHKGWAVTRVIVGASGIRSFRETYQAE